MQHPAATLPPRYSTPRRISVGGMGEIYLADDTALGRPVVMKVLSDRYARDPAVRRRFLREANAAAQLSGHPHVVTIYDVGEWDDRAFIAMEYLPNGDLRQRLAEGVPPFETSLGWLSEAAAALDAAHRGGIVHRDVKPANLLLDGQCSLRVADFGIARVADATTTSMTLPGTVMGTAGYISPEQARGDPATPASDIYSLAAVAYELITGRRPFAREADTDELAAHIHAPLAPASQTRGVPAAADAVFERAMAKNPAARYSTAEAFTSALAAALRSADRPTLVMVPRRESAPRKVSTYGARPPSRGLLPAAALAAVALLALLAGAAGAYTLSRGGGSPAVRTVVRERTVHRVVVTHGSTVTVPQTEVRTVTVPAATSSSPSRPPGVPTAGHALNDQGYAAMRSGNYASALAPLQQAVRDLRGAGPADPYEAYSNYNLGYTLLQLGRCSEAIAPLERAERLESSPSVPAALARARACAGSR